MNDRNSFVGRWITDGEFYALEPRSVFHRQKDKQQLPEEHLNAHILFRRSFDVDNLTRPATLHITADDYYKLYINGVYVECGPAPSYHINYGYRSIDVTDYLHIDRNVIAVHTLYQGLINRVWQSGDLRHGLIYDLYLGEVCVLFSDENTLTHRHTAYSVSGRVGYDTQFLETYDSRAAECRFYEPDFDDSCWEHSHISLTADHTLVPQSTKPVCLENISPTVVRREGERVFLDFGKIYVGYLSATVRGKRGDTVTVRCAQELNDDGSVRYALRANCVYTEDWILSGGTDTLDWFDYKSFRYAELILPSGAELMDASLVARHYPFELAAGLKDEYKRSAELRSVWELATNSQRYGVQEVIMDCMEREKGFYVGDGCYTALAHAILTGDDSIARKLIDDAFLSTFITDGMVTCLDCSFMQEIAEYPLMLISFILWHYRVFGDTEYLRKNYPHAVALLEVYRRDYECPDGLLRNLDKWCVVEWPDNYRDGYDIDIREWQVCTTAHVSINAYYLEAIHTVNLMARALGVSDYRDERPLRDAFNEAFYLPDKRLYRDGENTYHTSLVGNIFPFAFALSEDEEFYLNLEQIIKDRGIRAVSMFTSFPMLVGLVRRGNFALLREQLTDKEAWLRTIREGSMTTFEGWGKDCKWNTSLFHMTMSDVAVFLADNVDVSRIFNINDPEEK